MVNTISIGEQPINAVEPQASLWWKDIQKVKNETRSGLWNLWNAIAFGTVMLVSPSVFWQQTTQKVEASKSQQMTAMRWWNDTIILANNGPTTPVTKPKRNFDEEWDEEALKTAEQKAQTAEQKAQTAEQKAQTAEQKAQTAEQKAQTAEQKAQTAEQKAIQDQKEAEEARKKAADAERIKQYLKPKQ